MTIDLIATVDDFRDQFGGWRKGPGTRRIVAVGFSPLAPPEPHEHTETRLASIVGADFRWQSTVQFDHTADAHVQFRISGEGRYGVSVRDSGFRIYRQVLHSAWLWEVLPGGQADIPLAASAPHSLSIIASEHTFTVSVDGVTRQATDDRIRTGRFGLYAFRSVGMPAQVVFDNIHAFVDTDAPSNFSLLYSTIGYTAAGTKRALVRTLNPLPQEIDIGRSSFSLRWTNGLLVRNGTLRRMPDTYGMQLWEADFSSLRTPGVYVLSVNIVLADGKSVTVESAPFDIEERLYSRRLLRPLTIKSAAARNAADEDLRRHWRVVSGQFDVAHDGALVAMNANDREGSVLERVSTGFGGALPAPEQALGYTMSGQLTIVDGCDAQLQFGINAVRRLAVTLQAGSGGHCIHGEGPGAIRLHEEGLIVPAGFQPLAASLFPPNTPVRPNTPYAIRIVVGTHLVRVFVDGVMRLNVPVEVDLMGGFAIKAWSSSARFDRVAVWRHEVDLKWTPAGFGEFIDRPSSAHGPCDGTVSGATPFVEQLSCSPIFAQRNGFHDCNNYIGESNSHGAFVAGLVALWTTRREEMSAADRLALERAIIASITYLGHLFRLGGGAGRYKHEDLGRAGGIDQINGAFLGYLTLSGIYGDLSFAAKAPEISPALAHAAARRALKGFQWLNPGPMHSALFYHQFALCAGRDPVFAAELAADLALPPDTSLVSRLETLAIQAAEEFLFAAPAEFSTIGGWRRAFRDTGQMIPWFEGIAAIHLALPDLTSHWTDPLQRLAHALVDYLGKHSGFHVIPQSSGTDASQNIRNWDGLAHVPEVGSTVASDRSFYNSTFFSTMALDMVLLGRMTGNRHVEPLAAAHLHWVLGLNPGVPSTKVVRGSTTASAWQAAAFVQNLPTAFARGFENFKQGASTQKSWLWGGEDLDVHREVWWFDPLPNGFMSIVNGHVLWEGQWDYYNEGEAGWISGETFMLNDGIYARALAAYEDWVAGLPPRWLSLGSPFNTPFGIQNQDGRLEIVATRGDHTLWHTWETSIGGMLADWHAMDGFVEPVFGMMNLDGRLELFGRGLDGALWARHQIAPNQQFAPWHSLEGQIVTATAARNADGRIELFASFTDGTIHHRWQVAPNSQFDAWHSLGSNATQPVVGVNLDGRLELFVRGADAVVYHRWQTAPNSFFVDWHSLEGRVRQLTIARNADGRLELFAIDETLAVLHRWQRAPNSSFEPWRNLAFRGSQIEAVALGDGRLELFVLGLDLAIWRNIQTTANGPFVGWESLGTVSTTFWAGAEGDGRAILLARQFSGELLMLRQAAIGTWLHFRFL